MGKIFKSTNIKLAQPVPVVNPSQPTKQLVDLDPNNPNAIQMSGKDLKNFLYNAPDVEGIKGIIEYVLNKNKYNVNSILSHAEQMRMITEINQELDKQYGEWVNTYNKLAK